MGGKGLRVVTSRRNILGSLVGALDGHQPPLGHHWSLASQSSGWGTKDISGSPELAVLILWVMTCDLTREGSGLGALNLLCCPQRDQGD